MATSPRVTRTARAPVVQAPAPARAPRPRTQRPPARPTVSRETEQQQLARMTRRRQLIYVSISDIVPYPYNPRDNAAAIESVAASIRNFGFLVPCVIDSNNVLVCGHTRVEASKTLFLDEVPCLRADDLSPEQINAFRLIDNKVAENAKWDHDLLAGEISKLEDLGLDFTQFGWTQEALDCMTQLVGQDCLDAADLLPATETTPGVPGQQARRSPATARFVLGELVFFLPIQEYRNWVDGIRQLHNFNEEDIIADLRTRLGILAS